MSKTGYKRICVTIPEDINDRFQAYCDKHLLKKAPTITYLICELMLRDNPTVPLPQGINPEVIKRRNRNVNSKS